MATKTYTPKELREMSGVHLLRAQAIAVFSKRGLGLKEIRGRLGQMSDEQLEAFVIAAQREAHPTAAPTPLPEPNYPSSQWEVVQIMHGMILMLDPTQGPVLRRVANEIYRHFAGSTTVVTR